MISIDSAKHFSMIRGFHLADFLTLANAASGLAAVLFSMLYMSSQLPMYFFAATAMTPAALLFDWLDGRVARWRRLHSALGRELDSLADIISDMEEGERWDEMFEDMMRTVRGHFLTEARDLLPLVDRSRDA